MPGRRSADINAAVKLAREEGLTKPMIEALESLVEFQQRWYSMPLDRLPAMSRRALLSRGLIDIVREGGVRMTRRGLDVAIQLGMTHPHEFPNYF